MSIGRRLARPEILNLAPYKPAPVGDALRLHANEASWRHDWDQSADGLNRYPDPNALALRARMADLYGQPLERILATRGSDDAIDALLRVFCRPARDAILVSPPGFEMYAQSARIQGARVIEAPLMAESGFAQSATAILEKFSKPVKLVFVCTPNNPTGNEMTAADIAALCAAIGDNALLVVDEAYIEFSAASSACVLLEEFENLVVLRTLSKAYALAGARCGAVLARSGIIDLIRRVLPPYLLPSPTQDSACQALGADALATTQRRVGRLVAERERMAAALARLPAVIRVYPSAANFLLVDVADAAACLQTARSADLALRDCGAWPSLAGSLRLTIGLPEENRRILAVFQTTGAQALTG